MNFEKLNLNINEEKWDYLTFFDVSFLPHQKKNITIEFHEDLSQEKGHYSLTYLLNIDKYYSKRSQIDVYLTIDPEVYDFELEPETENHGANLLSIMPRPKNISVENNLLKAQWTYADIKKENIHVEYVLKKNKGWTLFDETNTKPVIYVISILVIIIILYLLFKKRNLRHK